MIWDFKQRLFVSQRRESRQAVDDLSSPAVRAELQAHIDGAGNLPAAGAPDEYAALFEAVYPAEADRRAYMDAKVAGAKPSYGHLALATLMRAGRCQQVWTTNFDTMVADACARVYGGTGHLSTVALDAPELGRELIAEGRWPIEIKLHGDFRSRRLKNTRDELRQQDAELRQLLVDSCRRNGLVVAGYSGRDDSIMETFEHALEEPNAFPRGLFWLHRGEDDPLPRVADLLDRASAADVEASLVRVENFDETLRDIIRLCDDDDLDLDALHGFAAERQRRSPTPRPTGRAGFPVVRLNALRVSEAPSVCRLVACSIGGYREIEDAVQNAGVDLLFARIRRGVLLFGADRDARAAFEGFDITEFDLHSIDERRLRHDSGERGLMRAAAVRAITSHLDLIHDRRRNTDLLRPADPSTNAWSALRRLVGTLSGTFPDHPALSWHEGVGTRLDWANDRLWLLFEPRTVFVGIEDSNRHFAADFARERTVGRYNRQLNDLLEFWGDRLHADGAQLRALGVSDGVDATFRFARAPAFSRRIHA